jgi:hypothetical protein
VIAAITIKARQLQTRAAFIRIDCGDARGSVTSLLKSAVWCPLMTQGRCAAASCMEKQNELLKTLRMGGSDAVTAFVENCVSIHEAWRR